MISYFYSALNNFILNFSSVRFQLNRNEYKRKAAVQYFIKFLSLSWWRNIIPLQDFVTPFITMQCLISLPIYVLCMLPKAAILTVRLYALGNFFLLRKMWNNRVLLIKTDRMIGQLSANIQSGSDHHHIRFGGTNAIKRGGTRKYFFVIRKENPSPAIICSFLLIEIRVHKKRLVYNNSPIIK